MLFLSSCRIKLWRIFFFNLGHLAKIFDDLYFLYEYHLDDYKYFLKITDRTSVQLPCLLDMLSNYKSPFKPWLSGHPDLDFGTNKNFCWKSLGNTTVKQKWQWWQW